MDLQSVHRHCLKVQFEAQSRMPTDKEIFNFFRLRQWTPDMLHAMFREPRDYSVYVKFQTEELMTAELLKCPATDEFRYANGDSASVTFATAKGNFKYVRVFGLPVEVEDDHVVSVFSKYGKVHKVVRERYGVDTGYPILNGVRGVYLEVSKLVPSQVHIQNFSTRISYEGMQRKCFSCGNVDHVKLDCPTRVSMNERLNCARSFAGVLSSAKVNQPAQLSERVAQVSEFPSLEELRQEFRATTERSSVTQQQHSSSGSVQVESDSASQGTQQLSSVPGSEISPREEVSSDVANVEAVAMEGDNEQEVARKRGHEGGDSDNTSDSSGIANSSQLIEQMADSNTFKVPCVNKLLESQVKATKLKAKNKKSKK